MSSLRRIFSKRSDSNINEYNDNGDLERGDDEGASPVRYTPSFPVTVSSPYQGEYPAGSHTSYSDSEFSQTQIPVSPERYKDALEMLEGQSPTSVSHSNYEGNGLFSSMMASENNVQQLPQRTINRKPSWTRLEQSTSTPADSDDGVQYTEAQAFSSTSRGYQAANSDQHFSSNLASSSAFVTTSSSEPFIDVAIHSSLDASSSPSGEIVTRFSGFISDGASQRSMTEAELEAELRGSNPTLNEIYSKLGPGSSQTSSSMATDPRVEMASGRVGRTGFYKDSSSSSAQPVETNRNRLERTMESSGTGNLSTLETATSPQPAITRPNSMRDQDWETISDLKIRKVKRDGDTESDGKTGSSLADYSDSGTLSVLHPTEPRYGNIIARRVNQHPGIHRHHQAFVFLKDAQTGNTVTVPERDYQHYRNPVPLSDHHRNPFQSSPPLIKPREAPVDTARKVESPSEQSMVHRQSKSTLGTDNFDKLVETFGSSSEQPGVDKMGSEQGELESRSKGPTSTSSAWMSTTGEGTLPMSSGSFGKVAVLGEKGNVTGTPEGSGAREVGSSLAGASSPPNVSSSPVQSSPQELHSSSLVQTPIHRQIHSDASVAPELSYNAASRIRPLDAGVTLRTRRRRSSSESNSKVKASPLSTKASALPSPAFRRHKKRNTMVGLLGSDDSSIRATSAWEDDESEVGQHGSSLRERRGNQVNVERDHDSNSTESRPILHDGIVYTDVPTPTYVHPVYGIELRPLNRPQQTRGRTQARHDNLQRPIARADSPHLLRVPRPIDADYLMRQKQLSKFWLPFFCIIPPIALIFGYGCADELIYYQTNGDIHKFTNESKVFAIYWGYGATLVAIFVILLATLLASWS